jgi:leucyl-tRNA synthetase
VSPVILKRVLMVLILMLSPMAPHISEELWEILGISGGLTKQRWPLFREDLTREEQIDVIIQINGRLRGKMLVEDRLNEEETRERALADPRIKVLLDGKLIVKTIVVPNKLVNIVLK